MITDAQLNTVAESPVLVVHQEDGVLDAMDDWNRSTHATSGLLERVRSSASSEREAEIATLEFLSRHLGRGLSPMCGNSICQDRRFLARRMPELERFFHYRNLDVSTVKELARRWAPEVHAGFTKKSVHLALDDIRDSIAELRYYRQNLVAEPFRGTR